MIGTVNTHKWLLLLCFYYCLSYMLFLLSSPLPIKQNKKDRNNKEADVAVGNEFSAKIKL